MRCVLSGLGAGSRQESNSGDRRKPMGDLDHPLLTGRATGKRIIFLKNS